MKKWFLLILFAACNSPGDTYSRRYVTSTFGIARESSMTYQLDTETTREFRIRKDGTLLIRIEDQGVTLNLQDFPGPTITTFFDSLEQLPLSLNLPDGTRFVFHGVSFVVGGERYELPEAGGVVRYVHPGQVLPN